MSDRSQIQSSEVRASAAEPETRTGHPIMDGPAAHESGGWLGAQARLIQSFHEGPLMQRQSAQLRALIPGAVVQRARSFDEMRSALEAGSLDRVSNQSYVAIVRDLGAAFEREALAITADDHAALIPHIGGIEGRLAAARSTDRNKQAARNAALEQLRNDLTDKRASLQKRVADLSKDANVKMTQSNEGPRAGFEIESNKVYVIDLSKCREEHRRRLAKGDFPKTLGAHFDKRSSLFGPPGRTWEAQTDSTLEEASNLEIVTQARTPEEWRSEAARTDQLVMMAFVAALNSAPLRRPLVPTDLHPDIRMVSAGLRLFKIQDQATFQGQMTAAEALPAQADPVPDWWLPGLRWDAAPSLRSIVTSLSREHGLVEGNPKSEFGATMLKTPLKDILGRADPPATEAQTLRWVEGVARHCHLHNVDRQVAKVLVDMTQANPRRRGFRLRHTNFTWRQYFEQLLVGTDRITEWAAGAFSVDDHPGEDIGLGQLPAVLPDGFVIKEHRQFDRGQDPSPANYLAKATAWGADTDAEMRRRAGVVIP